MTTTTPGSINGADCRHFWHCIADQFIWDRYVNILQRNSVRATASGIKATCQLRLWCGHQQSNDAGERFPNIIYREE